jgi:hypothetical protein
MKSIEYVCPVCEWHHRYSSIGQRAVSYTDSCCCSDLGECVAHQIDPSTAPSKPLKEIMEQRVAQAQKNKRELV